MDSTAKNGMPSYLNGNDSEVSKLLNRLNIISAKEIDAFQALAKLGMEKIPYQEALEITGLTENEAFFNICMKKFEEAEIAVLRHTITGSVLEPTYVRLCNESSMEFFAEVVTEQILGAEINLSTPLPFKSELKKKNITIPDTHVKNFNSEHIKTLFDSSDTGPLTIICIPINEETFYFTTETLPFLCETCINRIKSTFDNGNVSHILARTIDATLSEFKDDVDKDDILVWHQLISKLYAKIEQIRQNQQLISYPEIFYNTIILNHLLPPKVYQMESRHQLEQSIQNFANLMVAEMSKIESGLLEQQFQHLMTDVLKQANITDKANMCKEEFLEKHVITTDEIEDDNFRTIIKLDQYYIHSSMLARIISDRYFPIEEKLKNHFRGLIIKYLTKSLPPKDFIFFEEDDLETAVRQKVMEYDELYYKILRAPTLLAATIINQGKENANQADENTPKIQSVSRLLSSFFDLRTKNILPWHEIFNLNIPKLGEEAYKKLGLVRRFLLIFSGRYKNMRTRLRRIRSVNMSLRAKLITKDQDKEKDKKKK